MRGYSEIGGDWFYQILAHDAFMREVNTLKEKRETEKKEREEKWKLNAMSESAQAAQSSMTEELRSIRVDPIPDLSSWENDW